MSQAAVSRRLSGKVEFSLSQLTVLSEMFGVPLRSFLADDTEPVSA